MTVTVAGHNTGGGEGRGRCGDGGSRNGGPKEAADGIYEEAAVGIGDDSEGCGVGP